jgi:RPA family protein
MVQRGRKHRRCTIHGSSAPHVAFPPEGANTKKGKAIMEPAERVFARDFSAARHSMDGTDRRGGPYVVTPGGAWCRRLFIVGALTEWRGSGGDLMQARVADPTGAFQLAIDRQSPDVAATLEYLEPPAFVAVTGQAMISPAGSRTAPTVAAEALNVVNRRVRDIWVLGTADATLRRLETLHEALTGACTDERATAVVALYGTGASTLRDTAAMVRTALESVRWEDSADEIAPVCGRDILLSLLREEGSARGILREEIVARGVRSGLSARDAHRAVEELLAAGECYSPATGMIKLI